MNKSQQKIICVIGAGSAGLTATKQCLDQDLDVICFEKTENLGGLWRYREDDIDGVASVSKTTIINTSKEMSAFSDFVPPENFANFMDHRHLCKYFELYAEHYNLLKHVRFNHEVKNVTYNDDYEETGKWKVTVINKEKESSFDYVFDGVMVCIGFNAMPNIPTFSGQQNFKGKIMHTHSYKTWSGLEDKVVVVVGMGNSGCDAAVDLSSVCSQVYLTSRTSSWISQRVNFNGQPIDFIFKTRFISRLISLLPSQVWCNFYERYLNSFFDHEFYGIKPEQRVSPQNLIANDLIANCIISGRVLIRKNIKYFTENGVVFDGMDKETKCDVVLLATGYKISFPFIDQSIIPVENNKVRLFKNIFQPNLKHSKTLAMIALVHPNGSKFAVAEIQSRWFALLMKGIRELPTKEEMLSDIEKDVNESKLKYHGSERHTIQVDFLTYMDEIATFVGCRPNLFRYAITDPKLWYHLLFSPCMSYQYRLCGPNKWIGARDAIVNYEKRVAMAFK